MYFVTDRGLNSTENLKHIKDEKLGFVVAQKVSKQKEDLRKPMLDLAGYSNCGIDKDGKFYRKEGEANPDAFRFKVIDYVKKSRMEVEDPEENKGAKTKQISVPCRMVFTFSPGRKARDLADLENQITRASRAVQEQTLMGNPFGTGWRALIQTEKEAAETKDEKEQYRACGLKQEVIEERRAIAGYAALVLSHPDGEKAQRLTDEEVLNTYHELVSIEDCFRVMKSTFSIRPVYVRLNERIKGHCYLCVLALMLIKSLQERMEAKGWHYSTAKLSDGLAQALALLLPAKEGQAPTFVNTFLNPGIYQKPFAEKGHYRQAPNALDDCEKAWNNYKKQRENTPFIVDQILLSTGLKPLLVFADLSEMKRKLGVHTYKDSVLISLEHMNLSKEAGKNI